MSETRVCTYCGTTVGAKEYCAVCEAAWPNLPHPQEMTADEREAELRLLGGTVEVPFQIIHQRIEALVGRGVFTHEIGLDWEGLISEARNEKRPATFSEIIDLIPEEKRIVVIMPQEAEL